MLPGAAECSMCGQSLSSFDIGNARGGGVEEAQQLSKVACAMVEVSWLGACAEGLEFGPMTLVGRREVLA